jgi:hypothetical protein
MNERRKLTMADYIPEGDASFRIWADNFMSCVSDHPEDFGLSPADLAEVSAMKPEWDDALDANLTAHAAAKAARIRKTERRAAFEAAVRHLVARIQAHEETTDPGRSELGITVRGSVAWTPPLGESGNWPMAVIDVGASLRHSLHILNATSDGSSRAKPAGVLGCEVWQKVGEPTGDADMRYIGLVTGGRTVIEYPREDAGQKAHYRLRWVNMKGEKSAWSALHSAMIVG